MDSGILSYVIRVMVTSGAFAYLVISSLATRYRYGKFQTWIFGAVIVAATAIITVIFFIPYRFLCMHYTWGIVLWIVMAVFIMHTIIVDSYLELLFIVLVSLNLYVNIITTAKAILKVMKPDIKSGGANVILVTLVLLICLPALRYLYSKLYRRVIELNIQSSFWRFIWAIPAMIYMVFYFKIVSDFWSTAVIKMEDVIFCILWSFITYMFFLVTLEMLIQACEGISAREEARIMASQLHMQEGQYEQLLDNMEKTARLQHDWRHHLRTLNGFAEKNDMESLQEYLKGLLPGYMFEDAGRVCDNRVADAILQYYVSIAPKKDINLDLNIDIPRRITVADTDLCIIIGNLVENAIEACSAIESGEKYIKVRGGQAGKQLGIVISNTYNGKINHDEKSYLSTKREGAGIGLSSVRRVVEKYNGVMKINYDEAYFSVNILIGIG